MGDEYELSIKYANLVDRVRVRDERIAELERENELLLNTIADDNKHLAKKDRVIALLRAVAKSAQQLVTYPPGVYATFSDRGWALAQTRNAVKEAIDGGALDGVDK